MFIVFHRTPWGYSGIAQCWSASAPGFEPQSRRDPTRVAPC